MLGGDMSKEQDLKDILNLPPELDDFKEVLLQAARSGKYKPNNWLEPTGQKQDRQTNFKSIMHHLIADMMGEEIDSESGLPHLLMAQCRIGMAYTRCKRRIVHPIDGKKTVSNNTGKLVSHTTPFIQNYSHTAAINEAANQAYLEGIRTDWNKSRNRSGNECRSYISEDNITNDINKSKE
jgi:microcystin-dependent protein